MYANDPTNAVRRRPMARRSTGLSLSVGSGLLSLVA